MATKTTSTNNNRYASAEAGEAAYEAYVLQCVADDTAIQDKLQWLESQEYIDAAAQYYAATTVDVQAEVNDIYETIAAANQEANAAQARDYNRDIDMQHREARRIVKQERQPLQSAFLRRMSYHASKMRGDALLRIAQIKVQEQEAIDLQQFIDAMQLQHDERVTSMFQGLQADAYRDAHYR